MISGFHSLVAKGYLHRSDGEFDDPIPVALWDSSLVPSFRFARLGRRFLGLRAGTGGTDGCFDVMKIDFLSYTDVPAPPISGGYILDETDASSGGSMSLPDLGGSGFLG